MNEMDCKRMDGRRTVAGIVMGALMLTGAMTAQAADGTPPWSAGKSKTFSVDCGAGDSLAAAVAKAGPGDRIEVSGECNEAVEVTAPHVTIDGAGAIIDGSGIMLSGLEGLLTVRGAQGVRLSGLTVRDATGAGVVVKDGAAVEIADSSMSGNAGIGLLVQQSSATVADSTLSGNYIGADVIDSSSLILGGSITASGNVLDNISIAGASTLELRGAQVMLENSFSGLTLLSGSRVVNWAFAASSGNTLSVANNVVGIALVNSELTVYTPDAAINATGNDVGIFAVGGDVFCGFGYGSLSMQGNGVGMQLTDGASATLACSLAVTANGIGINGDGAGTVTLGGWDGTPTSAYSQVVQGNFGADVNLAFGTRITVQDADIGTMVCDPTVLSRGTTTCP